MARQRVGWRTETGTATEGNPKKKHGADGMSMSSGRKLLTGLVALSFFASNLALAVNQNCPEQ
jgi:hypothetical protein